jgi:hypothetical protein
VRAGAAAAALVGLQGMEVLAARVEGVVRVLFRCFVRLILRHLTQ